MDDDLNFEMDQGRTFGPISSEPSRRQASMAEDDMQTPSNGKSSHDATSQSQFDPDTCRICRGEATPDEPLFYPCKCSGSIKYVHQDCLMEWLSHSQKKHCELCKTPFRFTKLYAPDMPKTVPFYVFISHITKYLLRNMLVWARAGLVLMVWLVWLPYLMRRVWSALFWLSDEGLGPMFGRTEAAGVMSGITGSSAGAATCPSSPLLAQATSAAALQDIMGRLPLSSTSTTTTSLYGMNITDNPVSNIFLNMFLGFFYIGGTTPRSDVPATVQSVADPTTTHQPTLLSGVKLLQKMTSASPALGNFAIDVMEGQIITVLVIICFILIILVRDYVVQQQPDINMRAAFAAAENAAPAENPVPAAAPPDPTEGLRAEDVERLRGPEAQDDGINGPLDDNAGHGNPQWVRIPDFPAANNDRQPLELGELAGRPESPTLEDLHRNDRVPAALANTDRAREDVPTAMEISTADEYVRIHRAAEGDPATILKIIRQENLEDRLGFFVQATQSQLGRDRFDSHGEEGESSSPLADWGSEADQPWLDDVQEESRHPGKGKSTMTNASSDARGDQGYTSRPRSATDGPQNIGDMNPLRDGNWAWPDSVLDSRLSDPQYSSPSQFPGSSSRAAPDEAGGASQAWNHVTPPSSTLGESAASSLQGSTPSSSENNDNVDSQPVLTHGGTPDAAMGAGPPEDWETMSDFNGPIDLQQNAAAQEDAAVAPEENQPPGIAQRLADFMWRDVEAIPPHELAPLPDAVDEFFDHDQDAAVALVEGPLLQDEERDQEVVAAAVEAGIDAEAEAIEDAEDLEGIFELLGMRGPIAGLFQNALFCAFLVSITLFLGMFMPYNIGRLAIWMVANPTRPIRILFSLSKLVQDTALLLAGSASTLVFRAMDSMLTILRPSAPQPEIIKSAVQGSWNMTENAFGSLLDSLWTDLPFISAEEVRNFSTVSHAALLTLKGQLASFLATLGHGLLFLFGGNYLTKMADIRSWAMVASATLCQFLKDLPSLLTNPTSWVIDLGTFEAAAPLRPELASWSAMDRLWAILGGYVAMCVVAALYLARGGPISPGRVGQEWEATLIDVLNQASGVMKVILIIGIEMLVFPLYCGLLLDIALLPLFEDTTIMSRVMFTVNYPLTSIFVHWFVGTGYMFHFALFVSMCRKIMRKGVLYFIRDPDDAEFHPVRDVLERNVTTQLRKILFSAFVYGALVIVCLGGVVWALSYGFQNVLPIHYSSNEPVLEFPIDLLFYNFLMPLAVRFFKPSDGLHAMYTWWFRKSARALRLTWFLFGERKIDEEGILQPAPGSPTSALPMWKTMFLEVATDRAEVVPKTWEGTFEGGKAKPAPPLSPQQLEDSNKRKILLLRTSQLVPDGRFVRAPASDQVKIPKGQRVFLDVTEDNQRQDRTDHPGVDLYSTTQYQFVYVPPNFRLRVFLFILFIWLFAAATGLGFTIIPLIFGRWMFRMLIPGHIRTNDIYAFSIGIYILGSLFYFLFRVKGMCARTRAWVYRTARNLVDRDSLNRAAAVVIHTAKLVYAYFFLLIVFPVMVASLMELYILIPLDTYMYGALVPTNVTPDATLLSVQNPRHTVRVMQSWTIGIIYLKLAARFVVSWYQDSRLAAATRAVLRHGWLEPDVKVLTRAFVIPGLSLWAAAVFGPLMMARACIAYNTPVGGDTAAANNDAAVVLVYRFCFFAALLSAIGVALLRSVLGVFRSWRVRIRDEAYLIGERLHNFSLSQAVHDSQRERRRVGWD
ncbi:ERAD-associated E3 ubiquitin-protein ligase doa10 [Cytospora mali]|uniref:RING-type E3 ubiquitin transferase n=1 Tax=Cytospora mali TaxID=578113 RepID=A0A194UX48_CYTMA|nr:ERAD-associated E3 ubiquitin-protein ligase doa10 [Valsa mali var. pyri (nom. inval.)]